MQHSDAYLEALELVKTAPLPADAAQRLDALEERIYPHERGLYHRLWNALLDTALRAHPHTGADALMGKEAEHE